MAYTLNKIRVHNHCNNKKQTEWFSGRTKLSQNNQIFLFFHSQLQVESKKKLVSKEGTYLY